MIRQESIGDRRMAKEQYKKDDEVFIRFKLDVYDSSEDTWQGNFVDRDGDVLNSFFIPNSWIASKAVMPEPTKTGTVVVYHNYPYVKTAGRIWLDSAGGTRKWENIKDGTVVWEPED